MPYHTTNQGYWLSQDRNGTEDEITIHAPDGTALAHIWYWEDEPASRESAESRTKLIVDALNDYRGQP